MTQIVLAGNSISANILYEYIKDDPSLTVVACVVDDQYIDKAVLDTVPSVGITEIVARFPPADHKILMAMGYDQVNEVRAGMFRRLKNLGYSMLTWIHPRAIICTRHPVGEGSVIMPGALVEPGTKIGCDCFLWGNVVVAHDAIVDDHCWLAAGAVVSGMAHVGARNFIGVNATIANKVQTGESCIIGGSAFISKNIKANSVYLARSAEPFRCSAEDYCKFFGL